MDITIAKLTTPLQGTFQIPGDKSLSHRALMIAAICEGDSHLEGLNTGEDVMMTRQALQEMGVIFEGMQVRGVGLNGLCQPVQPLYLGNSGTSARLLAGLLAGQPISVTFTGDPSLSRRPMGRVAIPLRQMGASIETAIGETLPMHIKGSSSLNAIRYTLPVPSAQIKSSILLAGLKADGPTVVEEPLLTRDHTERLLKFVGVDIQRQENCWIVCPPSKLNRFSYRIPGDPSAAAFWAVAATLVSEASIVIKNVLWNPYRCSIFQVLKDMGATMQVTTPRTEGPEEVVDITVAPASLKAIEIPASLSPSLIDEYPILAVAAACAKGTSIFRGLSELRHKESDRLAAIAQGLISCGVSVRIDGDDLWIQGQESIPGGVTIHANHDHRIAMSFAILGLASRAPITITGADTISSSDPYFLPQFNQVIGEH